MTDRRIVIHDFDADLIDKLEKIPDEDIASGRHSLAECVCRMSDDCRAPVRYRMVVEISQPDGEYLDTRYYCETHKP